MNTLPPTSDTASIGLLNWASKAGPSADPTVLPARVVTCIAITMCYKTKIINTNVDNMEETTDKATITMGDSILRTYHPRHRHQANSTAKHICYDQITSYGPSESAVS